MRLQEKPTQSHGDFLSGPAIMLLLTAVAFVLRFVFVQFRVLFSDADAVTYINYAQGFNFGLSELASSIPIRMGPLYPFLIRLVNEVIGGELAYSARLVSVVLGALVVIPFYRLASSLYDDRIAAVASLLLVFSYFMVDISLNALTESTFVFFFVLAAHLMVAAYRSHSNVAYFAGGLGLALSYLVRPEALLFLPVAVLGGILAEWQSKRGVKRGMLGLGSLVVGCMLLTGPYLYLTYERTGKWTISGKATNILLQHGVDKSDEYWYEKRFYGLSPDGTELARAAGLGAREGNLAAFIKDVPREIKVLGRNLYAVYRYSLPAIFAPLWLAAMGVAVAVRTAGIVRSRRWSEMSAELVMAAIVVPYIVIVSLHNLAVRHFAAIIPFLILLSAVGIVEMARLCTPAVNSRRSVASVLIVLGASTLILGLDLRELSRPVWDPTHNSKSDLMLFKETGEWMKANLPPGPTILARKPFIAYYAGGVRTALPFASLDEVLVFAKAQNVRYMEINTMHVRWRPQLAFLLESEETPEHLTLVKTFSDGAHTLKLYRLD